MFDHLQEGRWWDVGLQLVEGCTKVSPGCDNCWSLTAANMRRFNPNPKTAARYKGTVYRHIGKLDDQCRECQDPPNECEGPCRPQWTGQVNPQWQDLDKIGCARKPQVYTFWNDLFHPGVPFDLCDNEEKFMDGVILAILCHPQHFYVICTKRPERALEYFLSRQADLDRWQNAPQLPNAKDILSRRLMLMTTAENQGVADLRLPILLQIPGVLHGVSVEPGLAPVNFRWATWAAIKDGLNAEYDGIKGLDWVICGGETGPHARPMHPNIPRQLRDQCHAAQVPFYFKSWGEWAPGPVRGEINNGPGSATGFLWPDGTWSIRVGKKAAGRTLDECDWDEVPHGL